MRSKLLELLGSTHLALAVAAPASAQPPPSPSPVVSPEIAANRDVTLRVRAPSAERVQLVSGGDIPGVPMQGGLPLAKGTDGVFQVMLPALAAGAYRYRFTIDGVPTGDPSNPATSESNGNAWSLVHVPAPSSWTRNDVPHGSVAEVHYFRRRSTARGACTSTRRRATRRAATSTPCSTCCTARSTATTRGRRSAAPASSSTT